ncbi:peptidoglycan D,D-transpeptidase FtsI family protein [Patescibacteria group bacterium]
MKNDNGRLLFLLIVILLLGCGILSRLFFLQILQHNYYSALAQGQHQLYQTLFPKRGEIFAQDLSASQRQGQDKYYPIAVNKEFSKAYIVPKNILEEEKDSLSSKLSELLGLDKEIILQRMNKKGDPYEPLKNKIDDETAGRIIELNAKGVELSDEIWRYYPNDSLASHLIGFVGGIDNNEKIGQYGIEEYYEEELSGKEGFLTGEKDINGYWIPIFGQKFEHAIDGSDLILTIDQNIQFKAEKELSYLTEKWKAESGTIIIMDSKSGAIRAMASWPNFNLNKYSEVENIDVFLNPAVQKAYEPGSVFKVFTMAAGIENGKVTPLTKYIDFGEVRFGGNVIRNVDNKVYGEQTMIQVLEKSLNTGAVFVQQELGQDLFVEFLKRFNFDEPTGIDIVGEARGNLLNLYAGQSLDLAVISFGQGITVTPIGLVSAFGAIANKGILMRPFLVQKIIKSDGREINTEPQVSGKIASPETIKDLTKMMVSVVENGFGKPAMVNGYSIAGKTGTAQIADLEKGGYSEDDTIHTFVGFAPAFDSRFVILVKLDKPKDIRFASDSVSPSFKNLAEYLFNYFEIPPQ